MSETKITHPEITRRELINKKETAFTELLGEVYGDIYRQMHNLYPCRELEEVCLRIDPNTGWFACCEAEDADGKVISVIVIGTSQDLESRNIKKRVVSRFGVSEDLVSSELGNHICRIIAFAHELGHVVQVNRRMQERFGGLKEGHELSGKDYSDEEYKQYIDSDSEGNADYIAFTVLASLDVGRMLGMEMPDEEVSEWRNWVINHPVLLSSGIPVDA